MNRAASVNSPDAALPAADHVLGVKHAKLTLLEYGDYECPACIRAEPRVQHLIHKHLGYQGQLCFVFRHFPLVEVHANAEMAAEAAEAAAAQGRFWPMHHLLFAPPHRLDLEALTGHAQAIGLDMNRFKAEIAGHIYTQRVYEHRRAGEQSGLRTTPAFFLNGQPVDVSLGFERLEEALYAALKAV